MGKGGGGIGSILGSVVGSFFGPEGTVIGGQLGGIAGNAISPNTSAKDAANAYNSAISASNRPTNITTPWGQTGPTASGYGFALSPELADQEKQINALKSAILSHFGATGTGGSSAQDWQSAYFKELQRQAQPAYEQSMFGRGLGGGSYYQTGLNDLLTKLGTQSVLGGQTYQSNWDSNQRNNLQSLMGLSTQNQNASNDALRFAYGARPGSFIAPATSSSPDYGSAIGNSLQSILGYMNGGGGGTTPYTSTTDLTSLLGNGGFSSSNNWFNNDLLTSGSTTGNFLTAF